MAARLGRLPCAGGRGSGGGDHSFCPQILGQAGTSQHGSHLVKERAVEALSSAVLLRRVAHSGFQLDALVGAEGLELGVDELSAVVAANALGFVASLVLQQGDCVLERQRDVGLARNRLHCTTDSLERSSNTVRK